MEVSPEVRSRPGCKQITGLIWKPYLAITWPLQWWRVCAFVLSQHNNTLPQYKYTGGDWPAPPRWQRPRPTAPRQECGAPPSHLLACPEMTYRLVNTLGFLWIAPFNWRGRGAARCISLGSAGRLTTPAASWRKAWEGRGASPFAAPRQVTALCSSWSPAGVSY